MTDLGNKCDRRSRIVVELSDRRPHGAIDKSPPAPEELAPALYTR